ncbi:MAG: hypothetical protein J6T39_00760, partial [Clostridia bacterium]|nr:hypothetical protein [Clostridia bacterium]
VKGNDATSQGYSNPVEVDYQVAGARCALSKESGELADIVGSSHLDEVPNELILGYYDTLTHEFHINENCILLAGNEKYKSFVEKATQCAEEIYFADVRAGIFQDYCLDSELEDSKKFREIIHDKEKMMDFIAGARFDYMFSEECKLYSDIENASFRNNVHFPSNVYRSLESYLSEKTDELIETQ